MATILENGTTLIINYNFFNEDLEYIHVKILRKNVLRRSIVEED